MSTRGTAWWGISVLCQHLERALAAGAVVLFVCAVCVISWNDGGGVFTLVCHYLEQQQPCHFLERQWWCVFLGVSRVSHLLDRRREGIGIFRVCVCVSSGRADQAGPDIGQSGGGVKHG